MAPGQEEGPSHEVIQWLVKYVLSVRPCGWYGDESSDRDQPGPTLLELTV